MQIVHLNDYGFVPDIIGTSCTNSIRLKDFSFRVPCGKCLPCQKKRRSEWSLRLEHEYMFSDSAFFITLTYDDNSLPRTKEGYPTLVKKDVQNYIKRLRNDHVRYVTKELKISKKEVKNVSKPIRYYAVGEYGSKTRRPHYHILLFNYDIANISPLTNQWKNTNTNMPHGHVDIGTVTASSINYVTKYMFKPFARKDKRIRPFSLMSKKPIIGQAYIDNYGSYHVQNEDLEVRDQNGRLRRLPKAYMYRLWTIEFEMLGKKYKIKDTAKIIQLSRDSFKKHIDVRIKNYEKMIDKYYVGNELSYAKSIYQDYIRQTRNINLKETI